MRPHGSPQELEARRRRALTLLRQGLGVRAVAERIGCSAGSVSRWQAAVVAGGARALRAKPAPGRPRRLNSRQRARLLKLLGQGAEAHGYGTPLWTLELTRFRGHLPLGGKGVHDGEDATAVSGGVS